MTVASRGNDPRQCFAQRRARAGAIANPDRVITAARAWIGTPHAHQHGRRGVGCDCLGLIRGLFAELAGHDVPVPPYGRDWDEAVLLAGLARHLLPATGPKDGAVLVFARRPSGPARHLAIQSGPDRMIHALERRGVREDAIGRTWSRRLRAVFLFPETL